MWVVAISISTADTRDEDRQALSGFTETVTHGHRACQPSIVDPPTALVVQYGFPLYFHRTSNPSSFKSAPLAVVYPEG